MTLAVAVEQQARFLDVDPVAYHKRPGFSASVATVVINQSPQHAKLYRETTDIADMSDEMARGAVLHHMMLGKGSKFEVCPFKDWRTDAAKKTRRDYHAAGIIPVLTHKLEEFETTAKNLLANLAALHDPIRLTGRGGNSEVAIEWYEDGVLCRCMMDRLDISDHGADIVEIKIHEDCAPDRVERHVENMGYRIAAAAYIRALVAVRPDLAGKIRYRFAFCEPVPPYAVYCPEPDGPFLETGERDWLRAVRTWAVCEREQRWPAYADFNSISRPRWKLRQEGYTSDEW